MALIKCPECGKEISSFAKQCIHCGYPLEDIRGSSTQNAHNETNMCNIDGVDFDLSWIKELVLSESLSVYSSLKELVGCDFETAVQIVNHIREYKEVPFKYDSKSQPPENRFCLIGGYNYDLGTFRDRILSGIESDDEILEDLAEEVFNRFIALDLLYRIKNTGKIPEDYAKGPSEIINKENFEKPTIPSVRCPRCGGTQITTSARGVNGFWGFIGASKTVNRCANCGKTWEPKR